MQVKCQNTDHWIKAMEYCKNNLLHPGDSNNWSTALKATLLCDGKLNGRYIENPTKEAYSRLIKLGYIPYENKTFDDMFFEDGIYLIIVDNEIYSCDDAHIKFVKATQMWFHNNDFVFENPDPHAELRKEYEAVEDKRFVKIQYKRKLDGMWIPLRNECEWNNDSEYRLKYYEIDWNTFLAWQYANDEWVKCIFSDSYNNQGTKVKSAILAYYVNDTGNKRFVSRYNGASYKNCRIPKDTPMRDEWLKEIKK